MAEMTFEQINDAEVGTIFIDRFEDGFRFIVLRGPVALCAYLGIPESHPLAGHSYDDLTARAHGGFTYAGKGVKGVPDGFFWYGWDYGHCDDFCFYDLRPSAYVREGKRWTVDEVDKDSWETRYDFKHLMNLAEGIHRNSVERKAESGEATNG